MRGTGFTGCGKTRSRGRRGFQPPHKVRGINRAFTGCGKRRSKGQEASGHDFSRAASAIKSTWALAPEGCLSDFPLGIRPFSAVCLAPIRKQVTPTSRSAVLWVSRPTGDNWQRGRCQLHEKRTFAPALRDGAHGEKRLPRASLRSGLGYFRVLPSGRIGSRDLPIGRMDSTAMMELRKSNCRSFNFAALASG
jgi:hypothetical protein